MTDEHLVRLVNRSDKHDVRAIFGDLRERRAISGSVGSNAVDKYVFEKRGDGETFEAALQAGGISYTNVPERIGVHFFDKASMGGVFSNMASTVGFVGSHTLGEVVASDTEQLGAIGGSFDAIADRMDYFIAQASGYESVSGSIMKLDEGVALIDLRETRGHQFCPFDACGDRVSSSKDYVIQNVDTGRELWVNKMTSHLARRHSLLEKENKYGISASEFYEHFMVDAGVSEKSD